jgi:hypothetical protein
MMPFIKTTAPGCTVYKENNSSRARYELQVSLHSAKAEQRKLKEYQFAFAYLLVDAYQLVSCISDQQ